MKIIKVAVLDAELASMHEAGWQEIVPDVQCYSGTAPEMIAERTAGCQAVIVNKVRITEELLVCNPQIRYVGVTATGTNNVDLPACKARGVAVTNVPAYSTESVAQLVFGFILNHYSGIGAASSRVRDGEWSRAESFALRMSGLRELSALTIGIVGMGAIGRRVAEIAGFFKMQVLAGTARRRELVAGRIQLDELVARSDIVTLHCPLTAETSQMINRDVLARMRPESILINTARGGLIDEAALAAALRSRRPAAAYADVLSAEPPTADNPLLASPSATVTPHIAWQTAEACARLRSEVLENLKAFIRGEARNRVC